MRSETIPVLKASKVQRIAGLLGGIRDLSLIPVEREESFLYFSRYICFAYLKEFEHFPLMEKEVTITVQDCSWICVIAENRGVYPVFP